MDDGIRALKGSIELVGIQDGGLAELNTSAIKIVLEPSREVVKADNVCDVGAREQRSTVDWLR